MLITEISQDQHIDALLVLGRGIGEDGILSEEGIERAEDAVYIARLLVPEVVVFGGGHSWDQELMGVEPPMSEGGAGLAHAISYMGDNIPRGTRFLAEEESQSTVETMLKSKSLLGLDRPNPVVGILSDRLHFEYGRVEHLGKLALPGVERVHFRIAGEITPTERREEQIIAASTRLFMVGVRPGNDEAIMRRQHALEATNATARRVIGMRWKPRDEAA
jgi:hypothetical protein